MLRRCFSSLVVLLLTAAWAWDSAPSTVNNDFFYPRVFKVLKGTLETLGGEEPNIMTAAIQGQNVADSKIKDCRDRVEIARHALFCLEFFERTMTPHELGTRHYGVGIVEESVNAQSVRALNSEARKFLKSHKLPFAQSGEFPLPPLPPNR
jgi:hypothetical protein